MSRLARLKVFIAQPFYPLLFAVFPVLFLYSRNIEEVSLSTLMNPMCLALGICIAMYFLLYKLIRSWSRAGILLFVLEFCFYCYGILGALLPTEIFRVGSTTVGNDKVLFPLFLLFILLFTVVWCRTKKTIPIALTQLLNITIFILLLINVANIVVVETGRLSLTASTSRVSTQALVAISETSVQPDVYYLVFDRYAGNGTLSEYGYDNQELTNFLKQEGFYIADNAKTNYPSTAFSLSSSLNMDYHDFDSSKDRTLASDIYPLLKGYKVAQLFFNEGYKTIQVGSWFWPSRQPSQYINKTWYANQSLFIVDRFTSELLATTLAMPVIKLAFPGVLSTNDALSHQKDTQYQWQVFPTVASDPEKKFIFVHMLLPHSPYVFDSTCQPVSEDQTRLLPETVNYIAHIKCANRQIENMVTIIKNISTRPYVILIQGDEGPFPIAYKKEGSTPYHSKSTGALLERTRILSAYYFPDSDYTQLYKGITPVNSFRVVFNKFLGKQFDLLPDKTYAFQDDDHMFTLKDVTPIVAGASK